MILGSNLVAGALSLPSMGTDPLLDTRSDRQSLAWAIKRRTLTCGLLSRDELPLFQPPMLLRPRHWGQRPADCPTSTPGV